MPPLLSIESLSITVPGTGRRPVPVVRDVSFEVAAGEAVGLVGESGSGKTLTALALVGLLPPRVVASGRVVLEGRDLLSLSEVELRRVRGRRIGLVFQEPMTALNPRLTIGYQVAEAIVAHGRADRAGALDEAIRLLERCGFADARRRQGAFPHELSGGQRQRVVIACALAGEPDLLLADEPTTALDVTTQAQILALLAELQAELGLAVLLITHDLAVVAERCRRVLVMYAGQIVERSSSAALFAGAAHPYSRALVAALPRPPVPGRSRRQRIGRALPGAPPDPGELPEGCPFHPRCPEREERCRRRAPSERQVPGQPGRSARCLLVPGPEPEEAP